MRTSLTSLSALAASATLAALPQPAVAQEAEAWRLGQGPENCYLSRSFGSGPQKIDVLIQAFGSTSPYHIVVRSSALPLRPQRALVARISFGGSLAPTDTFAIVGKSGSVPTAVFAATRHSVAMNATVYAYNTTDALLGVPIDADGETLTFELESATPLSIPLGSMVSEYVRLDTCTQALEDKWTAAAIGGGAPVKGPELLHPGETSWHMKYPEDLLLNLISGIAELRMTVDAAGRARDCVVQMSTWAPRFGAASCETLEHIARFKPALDAQGNAVSAPFRTSVLFIDYKW